ncbi:MAG TPA: lysophospholipase, partial [Phototrophicaceae bacterium]|nr:lysophospholipase [Phototrophicaceae bacterium]
MPISTFQTADGLTIYTESVLPAGNPKAVVLIVHGYAEHSGRYRHVIDRLVASGYAVYTLDHRGHGQSDGLRAYCDRMDQFVEDLQLYFERVKAAQPNKKRFLLGHSMGALINLAFTERHQDEIDALVISGAPVLADANVSPALVWVGNIMTRLAPRLPFVKVNQPGILSSDPEIDKAWESDPLTYKGLMRVRLGVELNNMARAVRERLSELHQPILILHGAQDR